MTEDIHLIAIDLQNDFASPGGRYRIKGDSVDFITSTLVPFMREHGIRASEIVSDYRQPRRGDRRECCRPGEWGYRSILPRDVVDPPVWVKSMNSPIWVRENGGSEEGLPGEPYQDPKAFDLWLSGNIGAPGEIEGPFLFGLAADRCVLATAMELSWRGYEPFVITEATDVASGSSDERSRFLSTSPFTNWARAGSFNKFRSIVESGKGS